ncbi:DUF1493 family protein [Pseudescherichia sp.]
MLIKSAKAGRWLYD